MPTIRVSSISLAPSREVTSTAAEAVTGTRNIILLLVKFSGDSQEPHTPSWYTDVIFNPSTGNTVNSYYLANSWGQLGWTATATNWMTGMDYKTTYANCVGADTCADLNHLFDDAVKLGVDAGVNFALYDNIAIVTNNDLDCCAYGAALTYEGKTYGVVWEPPWSAQVGTFAHELGHSIGLPHSGWVYYHYDSPWDVMSRGDKLYNNVACGSYRSWNLSNATKSIWCPTPTDIIAPYKDVVGWIDEAHLLTVPAGASAVGALVDSLAAPLSSKYKMIKVCLPGYDCTSGGEHALYYTAEVRTRYGFDSYLGIPQSDTYSGAPRRIILQPPNAGGVVVHIYNATHLGYRPNHCFRNDQSGPASPMDNFNVVPAPHYQTEYLPYGGGGCSERINGLVRGLYYASWNDRQVFTGITGATIGPVSHSTASGVTTYSVDVNGPPPYAVIFQQTGIPTGVTWGVTVGAFRYTTDYVRRTVWVSGTTNYQYDSSVQTSFGGSYVCSSGCSGSVSGPGTVTATYTYQSIIIARNLRPSISSLTADPESPSKVGTDITFTCTASDPENDAIQYKFWVRVEGGSWVVAQDWSKSNVYVWTPVRSGTYDIRCGVIDGKHLSLLGYDAARIVYGYEIL